MFFDWASSSESDTLVKDLLHVAANKNFDLRQVIFALDCLTWLHKKRSFSQREGFDESGNVSANETLLAEFKNLANGKYNEAENLDNLMLGLYRFKSLLLKDHEEEFPGYEMEFSGLTVNDYSFQRGSQCELKDDEVEQKIFELDKSFYEYFVGTFVTIDFSSDVVGNEE